MELYLLRHGKAEDRKNLTSDFKRNLTITGKEELVIIGKSLREQKIRFDYVFTSPLLRAKQTAEIITQKLKTKNKLTEWDELKPEGKIKDLYSKLALLRMDSKVLLVGHEPFLSDLIVDIITQGKNTECGISLKKAGFAKLTIFSTNPKQFSGDLNWLLTPKIFKKFSK